MLSTSMEYRRIIHQSSRRFYGNAEITLADDTVLNIDGSRIKQFKVYDAVSASGEFTALGFAGINKLTLAIDNHDDLYSDYDFTGAIIRASEGLQLSETIETLQKGIFTSDGTPKTKGSIITLTGLDNMHKFDVEYSDVEIEFPCTAGVLLQTVCTHCGVFLGTPNFDQKDYLLHRRPADEAISCRDIVVWIAQISGYYARINVTGALELKWFNTAALENEIHVDGGHFDEGTPFYTSGDNIDGGRFKPWTAGDNINGGTFADIEAYHHIYAMANLTLFADDVIITGVQVKAMGTESDYGETVLYGTEGYIIRIDENPLIPENTAAAIANTVGPKLVGMRFRPLSMTAVSDPSREAGDIAYVSDKKGNVYQTMITSVTSGIWQYDSISCDAESPIRNSAVRFSAATKAIAEARRAAKQQLSSYDIAIQRLTNLVANSFGVFKSEETLPDGSIIYYMHNKPTRAESQTLWKMTADAFAVSTDRGTTWNAGFDAAGNAVVNVLNAIGINADWITVGTLLGIRVITNSGKIGPFEIGEAGLFSEIMQFFEDAGYPLIWLTKPGPNGEPWGSGANGTQRGNYEPSAAVVRAIEDNVQTDVTMLARNDPGTGKTGEITIDRNGEDIEEHARVGTDGLSTEKWESGSQTDSVDLTSLGLIAKNPTNYFTIGLASIGAILTIHENGFSITAEGYSAGIENGEFYAYWNGGNIASVQGDLYLNATGHIYANNKQID